jgi:glycosyltransferase involved in cell wall biosynthesis
VTARRANWICCQLGAREHYAVPRALHRSGRLRRMITDAWLPPGLAPTWLGDSVARLSQRYHADLATANVVSCTAGLIAHEAAWRLQRRTGWDLVIARNEWFQACAAGNLRPDADASHTIVFAHSYAAAGMFRQARQRRWTTVLGQIDPGPEHYSLQQRLAVTRREFGVPPSEPPRRYFETWEDECDLADWIVVNSSWSRDSIARAGIRPDKIRVLPLPYEPETAVPQVERSYPAAFSRERPMRVLFVGTASVMKGVPELLEAVAQVEDAPIRLQLVGEREMAIPGRFSNHPRIEWVGAVDRAAVFQYYRDSDVLVFPSHSDGFGMAQVEAQGWSLPVVASRHCGEVVRPGETGLVLDEVSSEALVSALRELVAVPATLARFARNLEQSKTTNAMTALADGLAELERMRR